MFVTTRTVTETLPDGSVVAHPKNATLASFPAWDNAVQAAMLRMGYVQEVADAPLGAESAAVTPAAAPGHADDRPTATVVVAPQKGESPACPHCPGKVFVNTQGLRLHMTRMHAHKGPQQPA